jgi:hypothetical protein
MSETAMIGTAADRRHLSPTLKDPVDEGSEKQRLWGFSPTMGKGAPMCSTEAGSAAEWG